MYSTIYKKVNSGEIKMKKQFIALVICAVLVCAFVGCSKATDANKKRESTMSSEIGQSNDTGEVFVRKEIKHKC